MSGFDWKKPSNLEADEKEEQNEMMRATGDSKHPRHKEAIEKAKANKKKNIEFWKNRRAKYYTKKGSESTINKILNQYQ